MASSRLPLEIVSEVLAAILVEPELVRFGIIARPKECSKADWFWVEPLTLVSKAFRSLALAHWFQVFFSQDSADLNAFREMFSDQGITWIRYELHLFIMGMNY
jgi:hypothetical protein